MVYPRVRGVSVGSGGQLYFEDGSSPRLRGLRGKWRAAVLRGWVHPRVRGVSDDGSPLHCGKRGSSPRPRGLPEPLSQDEGRYRFIPASAGSPWFPSMVSHRNWVHPRVRGVSQQQPRKQRRHGGSSPRPRGLLAGERRLYHPGGFIPASAGSPMLVMGPRVPSPVHPRVRGVSDVEKGGDGRSIGSSPRPRGLPAAGHGRMGGLRFIPASAGSPRAHRLPGPEIEVHPRVRGVSICNALAYNSGYGSSPRPRGLHLQRLGVQLRVRFIPASAGSPSGSRS